MLSEADIKVAALDLKADVYSKVILLPEESKVDLFQKARELEESLRIYGLTLRIFPLD